MKPLEYEPQSSQAKITGENSYRMFNSDGIMISSENSNLQEILNQEIVAELTEENLKLHEENQPDLKQEEDYEFYSNFEDSTSKDKIQKYPQK